MERRLPERRTRPRRYKLRAQTVGVVILPCLFRSRGWRICHQQTAPRVDICLVIHRRGRGTYLDELRNDRLPAPGKIRPLARSLDHQLVAPRPVCVRLKHVAAVILDLFQSARSVVFESLPNTARILAADQVSGKVVFPAGSPIS